MVSRIKLQRISAVEMKKANREGYGPEDPRVIPCARRRGDRMKRREFISLVGAMTAAWPLVTRAHQAGMKRSGLLRSAAQTDLEETFSDGYRKSIIISRKTTG